MPISSGALAWPVSYYSKREAEAMEVLDGGHGTPLGAGPSPRGTTTAPLGYEWQPQLTNREDYEKWRKKMDREDPLKTKKKKGNGCFGFLHSSKINKENEDPTEGEQRDSPKEIIRRHRRRRCFLLALVVSLFCLLLMIGFVFVFLHFTGHEVIGPDDLVECTGQWRSHYLASAQRLSNGSTIYACCCIPDIANTTVWSVLSQSGWPDGDLFSNQNDCLSPPSPAKPCKDYSAADFAKVGLPKPSSGGAGGGGGLGGDGGVARVVLKAMGVVLIGLVLL